MSTTTPKASETVTLTFPSLTLTGILRHDDDHRQLLLWTDEGPERVSVNLSAYGLEAPAGHVFVKDWSEHRGLAKSLVDQGLGQIVETVTVGPFDSPAHLVKVIVP